LIRVRLGAEDLARVRVAATPGPFAETVWAAQRMRRSTGPVYSSWRRTLKGQFTKSAPSLATVFPAGRPGLDLSTLVGLTVGLDDATEAILGVRQEYFRTEIEFVFSGRPVDAWPWTHLDSDGQLRHRLSTAVCAFHAAAIGPHWTRVGAFLHAEQARQIRRLATLGVDEFLAGLCPQLIRWRPPFLYVRTATDWPDHEPGGRGLAIMPSVFHAPFPAMNFDLAHRDDAPVLTYPAARELGAAAQLWTGARDGQALGLLLGRTRSAVLHEIAGGCGTGELAVRVGISPAAASQHATVLRRSGLITTHRDGGAVLHLLTGLGFSLLNGAESARSSGG
jgi:DNA-binding transcriptional ArsR family regulator